MRNKQQPGENCSQHSTTTLGPQAKDYFKELSSLPSTILEWIDKNGNDIVAVWDNNGLLIYISQSVERLLGYKVADLIGMRWYEKISLEDVTYIENHLNMRENERQLFNMNIQNRNGKYIWTENVTSKIKDKRDKVYFVSVIKDITNKKEAEEMMVRSEKMSVAGQLAAGIAHEIRNPLTSLKGFLQLLQAGVTRKEEYYNIMIDEIEKMEAITSELLFISKPLTDNKRAESAKEMVDDVVTLLEPQAKLHDIDIKWEAAEDHAIYCDRSQIKQVLINLVKNAIEAMPDSGEVKLILGIQKEQIVIDVTDQGPGIPEEVIHKLGEPFFTTKKSGTGLGIMITTQILDKHGGKLEIMQNEWKGSTFRIFLPEGPTK